MNITPNTHQQSKLYNLVSFSPSKRKKQDTAIEIENYELKGPCITNNAVSFHPQWLRIQT